MGKRRDGPSRRDFLRLAAPTAALGPFFFFPDRIRAFQQTLRIARWAHFLPEFDQWFAQEYVREWGRKHDTRVEVDFVPIDRISATAASEAAARTGHDLFMFPWPPSIYKKDAIDHTEIYQTVAARHGTVNRIGHRSTFDPRRKRYFAFADSWMPATLHYFQDYWSEVGVPFGPVHYDGLLSAGARLRAKLGVPCGLALSPSLEGNITLHMLLSAFNSRIVDAEGNIDLGKSYRTITALKYVKALCEKAGTRDQLTWGSSGNVQAMQACKTSCTISGINLLRGLEGTRPEVAKRIMFSPPLVGSAGTIALPLVTSCSMIWDFSRNQEAAKQFLVDLIDNFKTVFEKSKGCSFPVYQNTVPDLVKRLSNDPFADPSYKYLRLKDALHWTANLGFPGFATPVAMEVFDRFIIPTMFTKVATGQLSPEDAASAADAEVKRIANKWAET